MLLSTHRASAVAGRATGRRCAAKPNVRPFTASRTAPQQRMDVRVGLFNFGKKNAEPQGAYLKSTGREEYIYEDVDDYFNYMGFLAEEGCYDRMWAMLKVLAPIDAILLLAASQNDTPKVQEVLNSGADPTVKGLDGKTPVELATKPETLALIKDALSKVAKA